MSATRPLAFKIASEPSEFSQIAKLNYQTFVREIPQHPPNPLGVLVDRFHNQNTYLIALADGLLVGMIAVRDQRPFSLDEKLDNLDAYLPANNRLCELRLLSVAASHRNGLVLQGLITLLLDCARNRRYDWAVISGNLRQVKLYQHIGFSPFGPLVGPRKACYQPMTLPLFGRCLAQLDLQRLKPQGAVIRLRPANWSARLLADPGHEYVVFLMPEWNGSAQTESRPDISKPNWPPVVILEMNLPPGEYVVQWLNPASNHKLSAERHNHAGGLIALRPPPSNHPFAGNLRRINGIHPASNHS